ncbi:recombination protein F [Alteripontixanthobacter muriae]|nr:recombination protein F [Alteripontixanthobacter muriae]
MQHINTISGRFAAAAASLAVSALVFAAAIVPASPTLTGMLA